MQFICLLLFGAHKQIVETIYRRYTLTPPHYQAEIRILTIDCFVRGDQLTIYIKFHLLIISHSGNRICAIPDNGAVRTAINISEIPGRLAVR